MELILIIEMLVILVLGITLILETRYRISLEKKINNLNQFLKAKKEELNYLKNANTKES